MEKEAVIQVTRPGVNGVWFVGSIGEGVISDRRQQRDRQSWAPRRVVRCTVGIFQTRRRQR